MKLFLDPSPKATLPGSLADLEGVILDGKAIKCVAKRLKALRGVSEGVLGGRLWWPIGGVTAWWSAWSPMRTDKSTTCVRASVAKAAKIEVAEVSSEKLFADVQDQITTQQVMFR